MRLSCPPAWRSNGSAPRHQCHARRRCGRAGYGRVWRRPRPRSRRLGVAGLGFFGCRFGRRRFTLQALFLRLTLAWIVAYGALGEARGIEKTQHAIGRLRPDREPVLGALDVELDAIGAVFGQQWIVRPDLPDEAAVARRG